MNTKIKRISTIAMLACLAYVVMLVGRIPVVLFLKYDPKDIIITLGGLIWGPATALITSVIVSIIEMITVSSTGPIGLLMNVLSSCSFACTAAYIYSKNRTIKGAVMGLIAGSILTIIVMLLWNYLITPIYMDIPRSAIVEYLLPAFLPFNVLKASLNSGMTFLLYKPVTKALRNSGILTQSTNSTPNKKSYAYIIVALLIVVSCVLFILSMNHIM